MVRLKSDRESDGKRVRQGFFLSESSEELCDALMLTAVTEDSSVTAFPWLVLHGTCM